MIIIIIIIVCQQMSPVLSVRQMIRFTYKVFDRADKGLAEKAVPEQSGGRGTRRAGVWRKSIPGRRTAGAKAVRQECADVFREQCGGLGHRAPTEAEAGREGPSWRFLPDCWTHGERIQPGAQPHTPGKGGQGRNTDRGDTGT